jgi:hypothetical protein
LAQPVTDILDDGVLGVAVQFGQRDLECGARTVGGDEGIGHLDDTHDRPHVERRPAERIPYRRRARIGAVHHGDDLAAAITGLVEHLAGAHRLRRVSLLDRAQVVEHLAGGEDARDEQEQPGRQHPSAIPEAESTYATRHGSQHVGMGYQTSIVSDTRLRWC